MDPADKTDGKRGEKMIGEGGRVVWRSAAGLLLLRCWRSPQRIPSRAYAPAMSAW